MSIIPICRCVCGSFSLVSLPVIYLRGAPKHERHSFYLALPSVLTMRYRELQVTFENGFQVLLLTTLWDEI